MEIERYFEQIVDPTIADFEANPTSVRHASLAAAAVFHAIDRMAPKKSSGLRTKFQRECAAFGIVDRIAHAFKHDEAGHPDNPHNQPLSAEGVISRPPLYYNVSGAYGLSRLGDPVGGVTLDSDRLQDIHLAVKGAAEFLRSKWPKNQRH
jgi:hypothetical protein